MGLTQLVLAAAVAAGGESGLQLSVEPATVIAAPEARATVVITSTADVADLVLDASIGRIEAVQRVAPGRFSATYLPPEKGPPAVAILSASANASGEPVHGWAALPVYGRGIAEVRTGAGTPVTLRVGGARFGPVLAGPGGVAEVPVVVPPGVEFGYFGSRRVDLRVPPVPRVHLAVDRATVTADTAQRLRLRGYVVAVDGAPRPGARPALEVTHGSVEALVERGPGYFEAWWTLPPGAPGTHRAKLRLPEGGAPAEVELRTVPGPAASIEVVVDRPQLTAGEPPLGVELRAIDAAGNPTDASLRLTPQLGEVGGLSQRAPGRYVTTWAVPPAFAGRSRAELVARTADGAVSGRASVALEPAPQWRLTVAPDRSRVVADGRSRAQLEVTATDVFGNPAPRPPSVTASAGQVGPLVAAGAGRYRVDYRAPTRTERLTAVISVEGGGAEASAELALVPYEGRFSVSPTIGGLTDGARTLAGSIRADVPRWWQTPHLVAGAGLQLGWVGFGRSERLGAPPGVELTGRVDYLPALAVAKLRAPLPADWTAAATVGGGVAGIRAAVSVAGQPQTVRHGVVGAGHASLSLGRRFGRLSPFVELTAFWFSDPRFDVAAGSVFLGGVGVGLNVGL